MRTNADKEVMLGRMMRLCAQGEHCAGDIRRKLSALPPEEQDEIVDRLVRDGYIDEMRYARAFARDKSALEGWGSLKIKLALQGKSVAPQAIDAALEEIDAGAASLKLEQLLRAKLKALASETDPHKLEAKLLRYAMGRGYTYEQTKKAYDNIRRY